MNFFVRENDSLDYIIRRCERFLYATRAFYATVKLNFVFVHFIVYVGLHKAFSIFQFLFRCDKSVSDVSDM